MCGELTLSLTVSLILAPALLTAEYKNDPNVFAPCVTLVVTVETTKQKINLLVRIAFARFYTNPFRLDRPSHLTVYLDQMLDASQLPQWHCIILITKRKHIQKKGEIDGNIYSIVEVLSNSQSSGPNRTNVTAPFNINTHTRAHIHLNIYFI